VLGNLCGLDGFEYVASEEVLAEAQSACEGVNPDNTPDLSKIAMPFQADGLLRMGDVPIYALDALVRRARSLQSSSLARPAEVRLHPEAARELGVAEREQVQVQNGNRFKCARTAW